MMDSDKAILKNGLIWYEEPDGTCKILSPTLISMGEDRPLHLMFPVHLSEALSVLPEAKEMASERDALLVLLLYGEASDSEIKTLVLELAEAQVLPLWIGEENRRKFNKIVAMLSSGNFSYGNHHTPFL